MKFSLEGMTLHVSDVERSLEFYGRIPGAVVQAHTPGRFALVKIGKAHLGLLGVGTSGPFHVEISTSDLGRPRTSGCARREKGRPFCEPLQGE